MNFSKNFLVVVLTLVGLTYWAGSAIREQNLQESKFKAECAIRWEQANGVPNESTMAGISKSVRRDPYCRRQYQIWRS